MKKSMTQFKSQGTGSLTVGVCTLLFALGSAQAGFAQKTVAAKPSASPSVSSQTAVAPVAAKPLSEEEETAKPGKAGGEGIKIHGHWVMDIKNPDGTLAKHLDFQNSLTTGGGTGSTFYSTGDQLLAALLSGSVVAADPSIFFVGFKPASATLPANADITNLCYDQSTAPCGILTTPTNLFASVVYFQAVEVDLATRVNFSPTVSWVLSGNFTIPSGMTSLTAVQVYLALCAPPAAPYINTNARLTGSSADGGAASITPNSCVAKNSGSLNFTEGPLTSTLVPNAPQTIVPGQIIQVTVTLSFS